MRFQLVVVCAMLCSFVLVQPAWSDSAKMYSSLTRMGSWDLQIGDSRASLQFKKSLRQPQGNEQFVVAFTWKDQGGELTATGRPSKRGNWPIDLFMRDRRQAGTGCRGMLSPSSGLMSGTCSGPDGEKPFAEFSALGASGRPHAAPRAGTPALATKGAVTLAKPSVIAAALSRPVRDNRARGTVQDHRGRGQSNPVGRSQSKSGDSSADWKSDQVPTKKLANENELNSWLHTNASGLGKTLAVLYPYGELGPLRDLERKCDNQYCLLETRRIFLHKALGGR